jgi:hypothetical protein
MRTSVIIVATVGVVLLVWGLVEEMRARRGRPRA